MKYNTTLDDIIIFFNQYAGIYNDARKSITLRLSLRDFSPGDHTVTINTTDVYGQTLSIDGIVSLLCK